MSDQKYNGWTNYETWNVALWLDNDQGTQSYWADQAQEIFDRALSAKTRTREESATYWLADRLKDEINESAPDLGASMFSDLLGAALSKVNWDEIAKSMIENVEKSETDVPEKADYPD